MTTYYLSGVTYCKSPGETEHMIAALDDGKKPYILNGNDIHWLSAKPIQYGQAEYEVRPADEIYNPAKQEILRRARGPISPEVQCPRQTDT